MVTTLTPLDELGAVNIIIGTIGETEIDSLDSANTADVFMAQRILSETNRAVQVKGWSWNTDYDYPLVPNDDGEILLESNWIRVDVQNDSSVDTIMRGQKLYDRKSRGFTFKNTIKANLTQYLSFTDIPEVARWYVTVRAARIFQKRVVGSKELDGFTAEEELQALAAIEQYENETSDLSIFNNQDLYPARYGRER